MHVRAKLVAAHLDDGHVPLAPLQRRRELRANRLAPTKERELAVIDPPQQLGAGVVGGEVLVEPLVAGALRELEDEVVLPADLSEPRSRSSS